MTCVSKRNMYQFIDLWPIILRITGCSWEVQAVDFAFAGKYLIGQSFWMKSEVCTAIFLIKKF